MLLLGVIAVAAGLFVLYGFDPARHSFYPRCWFYSVTGLQCPGCGMLRASHALLHGNVAEAFRLNGWFVAGLPLLAAIVLVSFVRRKRRSDRPEPLLPPAWIWLLGGITIGFGILRNLI